MNHPNVIDFFAAADRALRFDYSSNVTKKRAHLNAAIANRNKAARAKRTARREKLTQTLLNKQTQTKREVSNGTN